jgi:hypothetical protein
MVWRSLSADSFVIFKSPPGAKLKATQDGGGSQPEEQHDLAAEVLGIIRRRITPVRGGFSKVFPCPPSFEEWRLDPSVQPTPTLVGTRLSTICLRH